MDFTGKKMRGGVAGSRLIVRCGCGAGLVTMALLLALTAGASAQNPVTVSCGETITSDTTLANDLMDCTGNGILIGADGITLDLNGHTVDGAQLGDFSGIDNTAGHDGVTIENGSVRQFVEGVFVLGARDNLLRRLSTSQQGHSGIVVAESKDVLVKRNSSVSNIAGIVLGDDSRVTVEHNTVSHSEFGGIVMFRSRHVLVADNSVSKNRNDVGIGILDNSDRNRVVRNSSSQNGAGIALDKGAGHNLIRGNGVTSNGDGVVLDVGTHDNRVANNSLRHNLFAGVAVVGSDDNVITRNSVIANDRGESHGGIYVLSLPDDPGKTSDRNLISRNTLIANHGDGILLNADQRRNVIKSNRARRNTDDGIDVEAPKTTLTRNTGNHNHDLGIKAVPGVTDGGGNRARANGNPLQCTNIVCT